MRNLQDHAAKGLPRLQIIRHILHGCLRRSGTLYFECKKQIWSKDMLEVCGISGNQVPEIFESSQIVGTIRPSLAEELGRKDRQIVAGAGEMPRPRLEPER
jgi:hypothetical protein